PLMICSSTEGTPCPKMDDYPDSRCMRTCLTSMKSDQIVSCNRDQGLICCPNPGSPFVPKRPPSIPSESDARRYRHVAQLRFLVGYMDEERYRCTAVLVQPNFVLTSALCGEKENDVSESPNHARLGHHSPYQDAIEILLDSPASYTYKNDLSLLKLDGNFSKESVATICTQPDFDRAQKLVAIGFSQLNGVNCDMFKMEVSLREFSDCHVERNRHVEGIGNQTHFCVAPLKPQKAAPGACVQCLRGTASVLHAVLPDRSVCVAGVATPTSSNCHNPGARLYYTSLMNAEVADFLRNAYSYRSDVN
ncbi:hypothetical protein KR054_011416, partial [Drosophila jambulina]